jgi:hypothetical protein
MVSIPFKMVLVMCSLLTIAMQYDSSFVRAASVKERLPIEHVSKEQEPPSMTIPDHPQLNALRHLTWLHTAAFDITGDREPEQIGLLGMQENPRSSYCQLVYLIWKDVKANRSSVTYIQGGYHPRMQIGDLNGDHKNDVLVQLPIASHRAAKSNYHLYTIRNHEVMNLPTPQPLQVDAKLEENYAVSLCAGDAQPLIVDITDRKKKYDAAGYYKEGKLLQPNTSFTTTPYHMLNLVDWDKKGKMDLAGVQIVHGLNKEDPVALVQSVWTWEKGKWKLVHVYMQKAFL